MEWQEQKAWSHEKVTIDDISNHVKYSIKNRIFALGCKKKESKYWDRFINVWFCFVVGWCELL